VPTVRPRFLDFPPRPPAAKHSLCTQNPPLVLHRRPLPAPHDLCSLSAAVRAAQEGKAEAQGDAASGQDDENQASDSCESFVTVPATLTDAPSHGCLPERRSVRGLGIASERLPCGAPFAWCHFSCIACMHACVILLTATDPSPCTQQLLPTPPLLQGTRRMVQAKGQVVRCRFVLACKRL
jgi:hypothetical protein